MHQDRNLQVLELLANGINPLNNEPFPPDHPCQHPEVIRALFNAMTVIKRAPFPPLPQKKIINPGEPAKKGVPWSKEEDRKLTDSFRENISLEELAKQHERSRTAIETRLAKLGLIQSKFAPILYSYNNHTEADAGISTSEVQVN